MDKTSPRARDLSAAERGQMIQRVLVDGWTAAQAAAAFGVAERQVNRWVAAYRRDGMASLRDDAALEHRPWRWLRRLSALFGSIAAALRGDAEPRPVRCIVLPSASEARRSPPGPDRRSRWN